MIRTPPKKLERAVGALSSDADVDPAVLRHLSPLGW
jgi:hypothetical protein